MMSGGQLEEVLFGAFQGTASADAPPLSARDSQRFSKWMAAFEAVTCFQIKHIGDKELGPGYTPQPIRRVIHVVQACSV